MVLLRLRVGKMDDLSFEMQEINEFLSTELILHMGREIGCSRENEIQRYIGLPEFHNFSGSALRPTTWLDFWRSLKTKCARIQLGLACKRRVTRMCCFYSISCLISFAARFATNFLVDAEVSTSLSLFEAWKKLGMLKVGRSLDRKHCSHHHREHRAGRVLGGTHERLMPHGGQLHRFIGANVYRWRMEASFKHP